MLLEGKKLLITGVLTDDSMAYAVAKVAQEAGAEIVLTSFGRARSLTERVAKKLPGGAPDVLELDVNDQTHIDAVSRDLIDRWGHVDGVLHSIGFAPSDVSRRLRGARPGQVFQPDLRSTYAFAGTCLHLGLQV